MEKETQSRVKSEVFLVIFSHPSINVSQPGKITRIALYFTVTFLEQLTICRTLKHLCHKDIYVHKLNRTKSYNTASAFLAEKV